MDIRSRVESLGSFPLMAVEQFGLVAAKATPQNREIITRIVRERKSNFLSTDFIL